MLLRGAVELSTSTTKISLHIKPVFKAVVKVAPVKNPKSLKFTKHVAIRYNCTQKIKAVPTHKLYRKNWHLRVRGWSFRTFPTHLKESVMNNLLFVLLHPHLPNHPIHQVVVLTALPIQRQGWHRTVMRGYRKLRNMITMTFARTFPDSILAKWLTTTYQVTGKELWKQPSIIKMKTVHNTTGITSKCWKTNKKTPFMT